MEIFFFSFLRWTKVLSISFSGQSVELTFLDNDNVYFVELCEVHELFMNNKPY